MTIPHAHDRNTPTPSDTPETCPVCVVYGDTGVSAPGAFTCEWHRHNTGPLNGAQPTQRASARRPYTDRVGDGYRPFRLRAPTPDGTFRVRRVDIAAAIPDGYCRTRDQAAALRALEDTDLDTHRAHFAAHVRAVWTVMVRCADWATMTVTRAAETVAAAAGVSVRTVERVKAWLRAHGLIGTVYGGATARAVRADRNRVPVYVLIQPAGSPVDETGDPTPRSSLEDPYARTQKPGTSPLRGDPASTAHLLWDLGRVPRTRLEMLAAAEALRRWAPGLRGGSARMLRWLLRPWFGRGWSPRRVLRALDARPDGSSWTYTTPPQSLVGWVRFRLSWWRDVS